ncbi:copper-translocating P-type ATPase [Rhodoferax koreense]|uniref:P-type Zn(2+) transporter n=1 Tax=Rhodoferax koreensis TaxID=1842727 RepID=A0A1P8JWM1_9BURK|nr:cation-translocating P-type ATPase [Rhodoferax koreense]APW38061.1 copper-translocating P-type ATPase [Rhodoferax koreense]
MTTHPHAGHDHDCCAPSLAPAAGFKPGADERGQAFRIASMDCAAEESDIRRVLEPLAGIRSLRFHLGARTLVIDAEEAALPPALDAIRKAGYDPQRQSAEADAPQGHLHEHGAGMAGGTMRLATALGLAIAAEAVAFFAPDALPWKLAGMAVAAVAIWLAGVETYQKGLVALRHLRLNINALMSVAVTGAFLLGEWPEAAMVMALYAIAEMIEARAVDGARGAIQGLLALAPETAEVRQADGRWQATPARSVALGAIVRVKPGERIALDGAVTDGRSAVDQSAVTGESIPVEKSAGDPVFAGTVNTSGGLEFRVTAEAGNSTLARIIHAVEEAQGSRAPTQRFVDRFAAVYTPAVFGLALAVAIVPPLFFDWAWAAALYKALVLLVIACPCALVIATPVTVVSGLTAAARRGILIKGGVYLEEARKLKAVALDKTGTLTEGKPRLVDWQALDAGQWSRDDLALLASSLAARSDHPVSRAIAGGLPAAHEAVEDFTALPGRGVQGALRGRVFALGNQRLLSAPGAAGLQAWLARYEADGHSVSLLTTDGLPLAVFAVADTIKPSSRAAVAELQAMGVTPVMLTGDNAATARHVAQQAGIQDARGQLLPEDKLAAIEDMQRRYGPTAMVGDGINDAPALARADIGFAMGGAGTDIAMEAADVVIMTDDLRRIATTIAFSRRAHAVLWQNIVIAIGIKLVFFALAVFGTASMWMAVFADMGASLLVVANGLRLMRGGPGAHQPQAMPPPRPTAVHDHDTAHAGHAH